MRLYSAPNLIQTLSSIFPAVAWGLIALAVGFAFVTLVIRPGESRYERPARRLPAHRQPPAHGEMRKTAVLARLWPCSPARAATPAVPPEFEVRHFLAAAERATGARLRRASSEQPVNGQYLGTQPRLTSLEAGLPLAAPGIPCWVPVRPVRVDGCPWQGKTDFETERWLQLVRAGDTAGWPALAEPQYEPRTAA